jgi:hypothetical protein
MYFCSGFSLMIDLVQKSKYVAIVKNFICLRVAYSFVDWVDKYP